LGRFLVREDALERADAIVVLGGAPLDRAPLGAQLLREGWAPVIVFTGGVKDEKLSLYGIDRSEAALGLDAARLDSALAARVILLETGTSTQEEAEAVLAQAIERHWSRVIVVTTEFHTRRAGRVFRKVLRPVGVTVVMRAAPGHDYEAARWWESEGGLLMVNNEYMKLLWYALKH
jgi:uncharacterized SAM-binding protein YcdF (DUF218 family)